MKTNPIDILDRLMEDYLSPKARRAVHSVILLAGALLSIYLAANGDWEVFAASVAATLYAWANRANTGVTTLAQAKEAICTDHEYHDPEESDWDAEDRELGGTL